MTLLYHDFTAAKRFSQECTLYILTLPLQRNLEVVKSPLTRPQTYCQRCCLFFPTVFVQSVNCPTAIGNRARKKEFSGKWKKLCLFCHIPVCCCFSIFWQIILKALELKKTFLSFLLMTPKPFYISALGGAAGEWDPLSLSLCRVHYYEEWRKNEIRVPAFSGLETTWHTAASSPTGITMS